MKESNVPDRQPLDGPGLKGALFGIPVEVEEADLVLIPVPWEVTVSYRSGTANGPRAVLEASPQLDTYLLEIEDWQKPNIAMEPIPEVWRKKGEVLREKAVSWIEWLERGHLPEEASPAQLAEIEEIEMGCSALHDWVRDRALFHLNEGRKVGVLGGDHSSPLGLIQALATKESSFGILQIDAHADLREKYEGFTWSHASIMTNALLVPEMTHLIQVGLRDTCAQEEAVIACSSGRIVAFHEQMLREGRYRGETWEEQCERIVVCLPQKVYVSFDIDGLDPALCPNTGTPVPGGLQFEEAAYLLRKVIDSGREIIGFDLCEVAPGASDWDGSVGARVLYRLGVYSSLKENSVAREE